MSLKPSEFVKSSKTTEIYTHVSNKDLSRIQSPLDLILKREQEMIEAVQTNDGTDKGSNFMPEWKEMRKFEFLEMKELSSHCGQ